MADELIARRREQMTLDALGDLVRYLRTAREERKAVLAITDGWRLFRPSEALLNRNDGTRTSLLPPIGFDPATGTLGTREQDTFRLECEQDRQRLAMIDHAAKFQLLLDDANRANASFYPVDPRGLTVFDSQIGPNPPPPLQVDRSLLRTRRSSLRWLADGTDGLAIVNTNNITEGLARVVEDLSSYYLLGYYATGVEMDGTFHEVRVRMNRPGVDVRARRGYLAASREEMLATAPAVDPAGDRSPAETARASAIEQALGSLARFGREMPLRVQVAAGRATSGAVTFQVVGEVGQDEEWAEGAQVDAILTTPNGETLDASRTSLEAGIRRFEITFTADDSSAAGDYTVQIRARGRAAGSRPTGDVVTIALPDAPDGVGTRFFRRGPSTGNQEVATADRRFRRRERLRIDVPGQEGAVPTATLLDRSGTDLPVPVETTVRAAADGAWWVTADLALAPLAAGDYVVEISGASPPDRFGETKQTWAAFRVVP